MSQSHVRGDSAQLRFWMYVFLMSFMNDLEKHVSAICGKKKTKQPPKSGCTLLVNSHRIIARTTSYWIPSEILGRQLVF